MAFLFLVPVFKTTAQISFDFGADIMSRYIWRGLDLGGPGPSIQPFAQWHQF
jgi:hypothetical protein